MIEQGHSDIAKWRNLILISYFFVQLHKCFQKFVPDAVLFSLYYSRCRTVCRRNNGRYLRRRVIAMISTSTPGSLLLPLHVVTLCNTSPKWSSLESNSICSNLWRNPSNIQLQDIFRYLVHESERYQCYCNAVTKSESNQYLFSPEE